MQSAKLPKQESKMISIQKMLLLKIFRVSWINVDYWYLPVWNPLTQINLAVIAGLNAAKIKGEEKSDSEKTEKEPESLLADLSGEEKQKQIKKRIKVLRQIEGLENRRDTVRSHHLIHFKKSYF